LTGLRKHITSKFEELILFILQSNVVLGYQVWEMLARKPFADVSNVHKQEVKAIPEETPISSICPFIVILDQIGATGLE